MIVASTPLKHNKAMTKTTFLRMTLCKSFSQFKAFSAASTKQFQKLEGHNFKVRPT
jgi:hypothetical protein